MNDAYSITSVPETDENVDWEPESSLQSPTPEPTEAPAPLAFLGVTVIVWLCFLRPFEWISFIYAVPVGNLLGGLSLFVIGSLVFGGHRIQLSPEIKLILLLAFQMCLATPFAHWRGGAFDKLSHDVTILVLMAVAVGLAVNSFERLQRVIRIEAISLTVIAVVTLATGAHDSEGRLMGVGGTFSNSNDLAAILAVTVPFCIFFLFSTTNVLMKLFWACSAAAMVYAVNGTLSRSGLIALVIGLFTCLWNFAFRERRRGASTLFVVIAISALLMASSPKFRERLSAISGDSAGGSNIAVSANGSSQERQELLKRAIQVMLHHPLLGVGPGNFLPFSGAQYGDWHVSHNTYTQCGAEAGIPALLILVFMLRTAAKHCKSVQRRPGVRADVSALAIALRSSVLAYAVAAFFADTAYQFYPYFLSVIAGVLWQLENVDPTRQQKSPESPESIEKDVPALVDADVWRNEWA